MTVLECVPSLLLVLLPVGDPQIPANLPPLSPPGGGACIIERALRPGDVIVCTTDGFVSRAIRRETDGPVSHAMLYVGEGKVVEAREFDSADFKHRSSRVREVTLDWALRNASLAVAFRRRGLTARGAERLVEAARARIGRPYNYWGVYQQLVCRWSGATYCRFDPPGGAVYCSQLIFNVFEEIDLPLSPGGPFFDDPNQLVRLPANGLRTLDYVGHLKH